MLGTLHFASCIYSVALFGRRRSQASPSSSPSIKITVTFAINGAMFTQAARRQDTVGQMLLYIVPEDLQGRIKKFLSLERVRKDCKNESSSCLTRSLNCEPSPIAKAVLQLSTAV